MSDLCPIAASASVNAMDLEDQPETMGGSLLFLLKTKKYCDVTFTFPNFTERIQAHEVCLKARSPVFEQIFRMRKSGNVQGNVIEISDCRPEIFQQFLELIYSDELKVDIIAGALDLLQLSQKYKVHPLTKKCEELLKTEIPMLDSVKVFEAARRHGRREWMDRAGQILVESFVELAGTDALMNAEEETLVYLLESDDLAVQEVGLFQFVLDWGRNKVGASADEELLRNKQKNLISKIRCTNMTAEEFTKVVVPTGLLSAEESLSVLSYLCGDEIVRRNLKTKFNTTRRKVENKESVTKFVDLYANDTKYAEIFHAFSKHSISFIADRTEAGGRVRPDYFLKKTVITAIEFLWPDFDDDYKYKEHHVLNFNVSVLEYCGPVEEGNFTVRFQRKLLNCKRDHLDLVSVEPPVELISGKTYSVVVEDHSTSESMDSFRKEPFPYQAFIFTEMKLEAKLDFEDVSLTLKDIHKKTDYYEQQACDESEDLDLIKRIQIGMI